MCLSANKGQWLSCLHLREIADLRIYHKLIYILSGPFSCLLPGNNLKQSGTVALSCWLLGTQLNNPVAFFFFILSPFIWHLYSLHTTRSCGDTGEIEEHALFTSLRKKDTLERLYRYTVREEGIWESLEKNTELYWGEEIKQTKRKMCLVGGGCLTRDASACKWSRTCEWWWETTNISSP